MPAPATRPSRRADLRRLERKLDRLTRITYGLVLFQPIVIAAALMPDETASWLTLALLALIVVLLLFPTFERWLPRFMRWAGRLFGYARRYFRPTRIA